MCLLRLTRNQCEYADAHHLLQSNEQTLLSHLNHLVLAVELQKPL